MKVSVVIPVWNEEAYIRSCLESIFTQTELPDEVIVVDNNCVDKTIDIVKEFPGVKIVRETTQGMIPARNKGFHSATGDLICRTDADTHVRPRWIAQIKHTMSTHPDIIGLSGPACFYDIPRVAQINQWPVNLAILTINKLLGHDMLFGPNMCIRRSAWEKVKDDVCLDDTLVHEDIDLSIHLAKIGKIKFDTKLIVDSSPRRWKKLTPYIEYPYRYLTTVQQHMDLPIHLRLKPMKIKTVKKSIENRLLAFKQLIPFEKA